MSQQLSDYIASEHAKGTSNEAIFSALLAQGWTVDVIQAHLSATDKPQAAATAQTARAEPAEDSKQRTVRIVLLGGAILVGLGIFSFIASNWQEMTRGMKLGVVVGAMLVADVLGWFFKERWQAARTGEALLLLGSLIYGGAIFLTAQLFQIRANWPDGFLLWMFGVIAMAFAVEWFPLFYLAVVLGVIVLFGHPFMFFTNDSSFLFTSAALLFAMTVVSALAGWAIHRRAPMKEST